MDAWRVAYCSVTNAACLASVFRAGSIPSELHGLVALESLYLSGNQLTGTCNTDFLFLAAEEFWSFVLIVIPSYFSVFFLTND